MGKNKKKQQYSRHEFMDICCDRCMLCAANASPVFCYDVVYKQNPKRFISHVFKNLIDITSKIANGEDVNNDSPEEEASRIFSKVFYDVYFSNIKESRELFIEQVCGNEFDKTDKDDPDETELVKDSIKSPFKCIRISKKQKKNKKNKQKRFVAEAYPTFFCNPGFIEEINNTLNGNDHKQQDKVEEHPGESETVACEATNTT